MEKLTTGAAIVEQQDTAGVKSLCIPKAYTTRRGLQGKDCLYITYTIVNDLLIVEATEYFRDGAVYMRAIEHEISMPSLFSLWKK